MEVANTEGIISILRERDILIKRDVIESAMEDSVTGPGNAEWMSKHLRPETLLSMEELSLYTKLENSGALQPILRDPGLDATRPFLEDDMRSAIRSLEASTAIIQQKSCTLTAQCEMLKKKLHRQEGLEQNRSRDIARLRKKHEGAKQNTTILANDISDELDAGFRSETDKAGVENKRILSLLSTRLKHDDRLLSTLEKLMPVVKSNVDDASTVKRAAHLSEALADYSAEEIHYRLDRYYLEESMQAGDLNSLSGAEGETITALEEELEALYPEIEILAEMSTKQQFHEPILREIYNGHSLLRETSQQKLGQILDVLSDMTLSKQELTAQLANRESLCELLEQITTLYQAESTNQLVTQSSSRRESIRRRSLQPGMVLGATRNPTPMPEQPSLENLLRRIGLSPESVLRPQVEDGGAQGLYEKRFDMSEAVRNLEIAAESPLVSHLGDSDSASQLLASSLHGNAQFETSLRNPRQEGALLGLETELASLQKGVQGLNLNVLHQRDKTQAKFLERWG